MISFRLDVTRILPIAFIVAAFVSSGCSQASEEEGQQPPMAESGISALQKTDTKEGTGAEARKGMIVRVHYTGWLYDASVADHKGQKFDSSVDSKQPFDFQLGASEVITGWDEGVAGMKVGGTRLLTIPPSMGYGARGAGGVIPPNATLLFEIELLDVK
jgi:FKBP-type peptidyl-prolyl cis-trans isomerase FkpA